MQDPEDEVQKVIPGSFLLFFVVAILRKQSHTFRGGKMCPSRPHR